MQSWHWITEIGKNCYYTMFNTMTVQTIKLPSIVRVYVIAMLFLSTYWALLGS